MSIRQRSILVSLKVSQWSGKKHDKKVTAEVDQIHGTTDAGRYNKNLVPKAELAKITSIHMKIRNVHYAQTLPWGDSGDRLLPMQNVFDYMAHMNDLKKEFEAEVDQFVAKFDAIKAQQKIEQKDLYNEVEYPRDIRSKFSVSIGMMPIGDTEDFRLDVTEEQEEFIRNQVKEEFISRQNRAVEDLLLRAKEKIVHMAEKLEGGGTFRNSLITNIEDLISLYTRLNFNDDPRIEKLIEEMKDLLVDPDHLRMDEEERNRYAEKARKLSEMI